MQPYPPEVEQQMRRFYQSLSEKDRRLLNDSDIGVSRHVAALLSQPIIPVATTMIEAVNLIQREILNCHL
jgi:hypothetical protein